MRLTKQEMKPYEARLRRSKTLPKYDITIKPLAERQVAFALPLALRQVDVWAAGRWLTCDDNAAYLPSFTASVERSLGRLLTGPEGLNLSRPYTELSVADNLCRMLAAADAGDNRDYLSYRFLGWGPTTDNVSAVLFREGGTVFIPFSFWRESHHEPSELGRVFVAELPERELLSVLHRAAWARWSGGGVSRSPSLHRLRLTLRACPSDFPGRLAACAVASDRYRPAGRPPLRAVLGILPGAAPPRASCPRKTARLAHPSSAPSRAGRTRLTRVASGPTLERL